MEYRRLGKAGIQVSELSFGSWITFGSNLDIEDIKKTLHLAFDQGVNFFDNAEAYAAGAAELLMGEALREFNRQELVLSTKVFWGGGKPNQTGLSRKHIIEGAKNSLRRMQLDYVDLLYCHRSDPHTPIAETVLAMDTLIRSGLVLYWGTSEWSAKDIDEAHQVAQSLNAYAPIVEQPEYNLFHRERVEQDYVPLYQAYGMGTTIWSPLDCGILTGKYNDCTPVGSRFEKHPELAKRLTPEKIKKVKALMAISHDLNCSVSQLALAWCLKNPHVSSVITGASNTEQLKSNLHASEVKHQLVDRVIQEIEKVITSADV